MGLAAGQKLTDVAVDVVFIGSCTNARIEDLRDAARVVRGQQVAEHVRAMIVPGSSEVRAQAEAEGLADDEVDRTEAMQVLRARLDREAPTHFEAPTGTQLAIDYEAEQGPTIAVRLQELFGLNTHPSIARGAVPLVLELLSPAQRPVQVTRDLPGFWRGSYAAVRSDLRGRYPRHPWPEDPASALPTRRVKPRGT